MDVVMFVRASDGRTERIQVVQPLTLVTRTDEDEMNGAEIPTTFSITGAEAQQMMDELWRVGVRPSEGSGSTGQLAAVQYHLEDMRSLVFQREPKP